MFVFIVKYVKPLEFVDALLEAHIEYLKANYTAHKFIMSGRQIPRVGGIIICNAATREEAEAISQTDPFVIRGVAEYEIIEFVASMCVDELKNLVINS